GPICPCGPAGPWTPCGPAGPCAPCGPAGPCAPAGPAGPCPPAGPAGPCGPAGPDAPCGPAGPAGPCGPILFHSRDPSWRPHFSCAPRRRRLPFEYCTHAWITFEYPPWAWTTAAPAAMASTSRTATGPPRRATLSIGALLSLGVFTESRMVQPPRQRPGWRDDRWNEHLAGRRSRLGTGGAEWHDDLRGPSAGLTRCFT